MLRYLLIFCLLIASFQPVKAQWDDHFQLELMTEGTYYWQTNSFAITTGFGLNYWPVELIGLNYEFQIGYDRQYGLTFNTGWTQVLGGYIIDQFGGTGAGEVLGALAILSLVIPEGVTFAINPDDDLVFMPYIIPLEAHYLHGYDRSFRCGGEAGLKFHYVINDYIALRPKVGIRYQYSNYRLGIEVGLGVTVFDSNNF